MHIRDALAVRMPPKRASDGDSKGARPVRANRRAPYKFRQGNDWSRALASEDRITNVGKGEDHPLAASNKERVKNLKRKNTTKAYETFELKFKKFCADHKLSHAPAAPDTVIGFMNLMLEEGYARSTINSSALAAIASIHRELDLDSPTTHPRVVEFKRLVAQHTPAPKQKLPMTFEVLEKFILLMDTRNKLDVRDLFLFELMLQAMLRESEAMNILLEDIQVMTIDGKRVLVVFVETSKTDLGGEGDCIILEENTAKPLRCIVSWYLLYLEIRGRHASPFLFVPATDGVRRSRAAESKLHEALPNARLKIWCRKASLDPSEWSSHSMRHGGATAAAAGGICERLIMAHGRWKSTCVRVYIHESIQSLLTVSRAIGGA